MGETVQTTTTTTPVEDPSVLAEAAVGAAAVAGAAHERADAAHESAAEAQSKADTALDVAVNRPVGITPEEARAIAREEYDLARNAERGVEAPPVVVAPVVAEVHEEVAPPSVAKANPYGPEGDGKKRFLDKWLGS